MDRNHALDLLQQFVLEHGLPRTEMALFGTLCPYCGKSDRIHALEAPRRLNGTLSQDALLRYAELWKTLAAADEGLGLCQFCRNFLRLDEQRRALPLYE